MIKEEKYSRIPVYEDSKDNVIGILNIKDIFLSLKANYTNDDLKSILRKPLFVVENMKADTLFKKMQDTLNQVAVVIDETGSVSGYLTMEDLVEEVMGNIFDEYDEIAEVITKVDEHNYIIDATIPIQDLNRELDLEIEKEEDSYSSLAGFITYKLESFPQLNDEVILEDEELTLKVIEIENTSIKKVLLTINK
jgi:putative hemolysin